MKKHHVKATFFVLTENVDKNPNLLRAIAADGHEIASHSNSHVPFATYWETNRLDQVGRLTNDRVLFLTFDDWGSDESINRSCMS